MFSCAVCSAVWWLSFFCLCSIDRYTVRFLPPGNQGRSFRFSWAGPLRGAGLLKLSGPASSDTAFSFAAASPFQRTHALQESQWFSHTQPPPKPESPVPSELQPLLPSHLLSSFTDITLREPLPFFRDLFSGPFICLIRIEHSSMLLKNLWILRSTWNVWPKRIRRCICPMLTENP